LENFDNFDNLSESQKNIFAKKLPNDWATKFLNNFDDTNQNDIQKIIMTAYNNNILNLIKPTFSDDTLKKAWEIIYKYELWIENIDEKYWTKLSNLIEQEYKYVQM